MKNLETLLIDTKVGKLEFTGTPTANDFDYKKFAIENGFKKLIIDSPKNTEKYGGIGFVAYKNYNESENLSYHLKKTLEILFINSLPTMYRVT